MAVKTNVEYHAMQHQIAAATGEVGKVEELILVNMIAVRRGDRAAEGRGSRAEEPTKARIVKERAAHRGRGGGQASRRSQESDAERREIAAAARARTVTRLFERVLKARQGIAVAQAVDGHCSICHVRLRPQVYNTISSNEAIVQCDHCQRILYFAGVHQRSAAGQAALEAAHARQDEHERPTS